MHFCLTAQYTSQALNNIMDDPKTNRYEAVKKLVEAAGGKLVSHVQYRCRWSRRVGDLRRA